MNRVARTLAWMCLGWMVLYLLWGGTSSGKRWFSSVARHFFADEKGGRPLITLSIPLLVSATVAAAMWRRADERVSSVASRMLPRWLLRLYCMLKFQAIAGDAAAPQIISRSFLLLMLIYIAGNVHRKLQPADEEKFDWMVMNIANIFGVSSLVALSVLLVPVTKFSPLIKVFGLSAPTALYLHQTAGQIVVLASLIHGIMHAYRWTGIAGESFLSMIIPPTQCWKNDPDFEPTCHSSETDCSCYDIFKNLAGVVAGSSLVLIGVSTLSSVRRHMYGLFYRVHIVAGPLVFVAVVVHWNRSILYLSGGMLYYLAMYAPVAVEKLAISRKAAEGITLLSAVRISENGQQGSSHASFLSLTFQADARTVSLYQPTQYVKIKVPELSSIAHPFSINRVPNDPQKMRLIIRESGYFTRSLAQRCVGNVRQTPAIFVEGFYGTETRLPDVLQHDVVVFVAGGIGITTYLTLIKETVRLAQGLPGQRIRKIFLHWICRESHLVEYVKREYFEDIASFMSSAKGIQVTITVHKTGQESVEQRAFPDVEDPATETELDEDSMQTPSVGQPFRSSRYIIGFSYLENLPTFLSFLFTSVLGLVGIWYCYSQIQDSEEVFSRFWVLLLLLVFGVTVGAVLNAVLSMFCHRVEAPKVEFTPIRSNEDEVEMEDLSGQHNVSISAGGIQREETFAFSFEEKAGRPSIHSLLNPLEESKYPAVFSCGPGRLMKEVNDKTCGRCHMRLQRCLCGEQRIALYEEAFEM